MGAMKQILTEVVGNGYVPLERDWVQQQIPRLGPYGGERLAASFTRYPIVAKNGDMVGIDAIPVHVARWLRDVLPDTADELDWALDLAEE